jgi:hypothetical protein
VKLTWCLLTAIMVVSMLGATDFNYDIGNFRPTDLSVYSLSPNLTNSSFYGYNEKNNHNYSISNQLTIRGIVTKDKPDYYFHFDSGNYPSYSSSKTTSTTEFNGIYRSRNWSPGFYSVNAGQYRKYINKFNYGADFDGFYSQDRINSVNEDSTSSSEYKLTQWEISNQLSGVIGYGRIYQCQEAYLAWYTLNELDKNACLNREFSNADVEDMATVFYQLRSLHEIDSRISYRKKVTKLLDYLKAKEYLNPSSETKAMAILLELWQNSYVRSVGTKLEAKPFIMVESIKESRRTNYNDNYGDYNSSSYMDRYYYAKSGLELLFTYEKPYHNVFQLSSHAEIQQGWYDAFFKDEMSDSLQFKHKPYTHLYADYAIAYYPDNRSRIALSINSGMWFNNLFEAETQKFYKSMSQTYSGTFINQSQRFDAGLSLDTSYQLTYCMSVYTKLTGNYTNQKTEGKSEWHKISFNSYLNISYRLL